MDSFVELQRLNALIRRLEGKARIETLAGIPVQNHEFPVTSIVIGSEDRSAPTLGLFGGVHGLERIGTHLVLAYLESLAEQLDWDKDLQSRLSSVRIVAMPLVNPGGMYLGMRSNPRGVDLNRNAPVEALVKPAWLLGGHRLSAKLPWYRGESNASEAEMEVESKALVDFVRREIFPARSALVLDMHSGFGAQDQLWYPYAKTTDTFPRIDQVHRLTELLNRSYPNHIYKVEPQSKNYTTHGDLWDYLFDEHAKFHGPKAPVFIPWTLEMGSWIWVRKNPLQLFSALGPFNPVKIHRFRRTMRRHLPLIDFFLRAVKHDESWK